MNNKKSAKHIVAIGASAGGLTPLQELIESLPESIEDTAIVIAQHLSPEYKSMLTEILSRKTLIPTTAITDGVEMEANHIYVTPPNCDAIIKEKHLEVVETSATGARPNIDRLFSSLAEAYGKNAVGIILSGTGQDGSKGIIALKNADGITISQNLETAKYSGMPQAAISTGMVEYIMTPSEIGERLISIINSDRENTFFSAPEESKTYESSADIATILNLLEARMGTDFSDYKQSTILRRLEKRLQDKKFNTVESYLNYIRNNDEELEEFFKYLLIGVTSFFRDPEAFEVLESEIENLIKQKAKGAKFRVWVPGCATGEESTSLAIMINELLIRCGRYDVKLQIFATDINAKALKIARNGIYSEENIKNIPKKLRDKYFEKTSTGNYELNRDLRQLILYTKHDLTSNPPFLKLDMISCRNLFIYFNQRLQNNIFPIFQYSLLPGGILFLGKSETIGNHKNIFSTLNAKYRIFSRKERGITKPLKIPITKPLSTDTNIPSKYNLKNEPLSIHQMVKETLYNTYENPYVVVDENLDIIEISGDTNSFLKIKPGLANMNLLRLLVDDLQIEVRALTMKSIKSMKIEKGGIKRYYDKDQAHLVRVMVKPLIYTKPGYPYFLVIFEMLDAVEPLLLSAQSGDKDSLESQRNKELEYELISNKQHMNTLVEELETTNEELQALNEELQSSNEELQASNEELETSNEELQATNEELENAYADLREASKKLSRQTQMWEKLLVTSPDYIAVIKGKDLTFEFANPAYTGLFPDRNIFGKSITEIMPELSAGVEDILDRVINEGKTIHKRGTTLTMDFKGNGEKETKYFNFTYAPLNYGNNKPADVIIYAVDITDHISERIKAEQNASFFSTLAESMPQKIWTVDADANITYINETLRRYIGFEGKAAELQISEYLQGYDKKKHQKLKGEAAKEQTPLQKQYKFKDKDGNTKWHQIRKIPLFNKENELIVWICTATDIHKQKEIEEKKDEFMSIASHELKTPLTTVKAYIELLEEVLDNEDISTARQYVTKASSGLKKINSLVSDLLDVTRIQTGKMQYNISEINFDELIEQSVDDAKPLSNLHKITLNGRSNSVIKGDKNRLEQVMLNLISNAMKYSEGADEVIINNYVEEDQVVFEVIDFGLGINPEYRTKIFERFYRLNQNHEFTSGLGIGLYISKQIISQHNGEIGVTGHEKQGSKFYVKLPIYHS